MLQSVIFDRNQLKCGERWIEALFTDTHLQAERGSGCWTLLGNHDSHSERPQVLNAPLSDNIFILYDDALMK